MATMFLPLVLLALGVVAVGILVMTLVRQRRGRGENPALDRALSGPGRRLLLAAGIALGVLVAIWAIPYPGSWLGIPQTMSPLLAAAVGLGVVALPSKHAGVGGPTDDGPRRMLPRGGIALLAGTAIVLVGLLVATGIAAGRGAEGGVFSFSRHLTVESGGAVATAEPFPGWFYGLPVLVALLPLAVAVVLALRRLATMPMLSDASGGEGSRELAIVDRRWRRGAAGVVVLSAEAPLLVVLAGMAFMTATALRSATRFIPDPPVGDSVAAMLILGSIGAFIGGLVALVAALLNAVRLPEQARAAAQASGES